MTFSKFHQHSSLIFKHLNIVTLSDLVFLNIAVFMYKFHDRRPLSVFDTFLSLLLFLLPFLFLVLFLFFYLKIQVTITQDSYTKENESGEEAQKETMGLIDTGLAKSKEGGE